MLFTDFLLDSAILRAVAEEGYVHPTPIQCEAIPVILSGNDVMGGAQTGTGKTASFTLPILQLLLPGQNTSPSPARHPIQCLILLPTRELAIQVAESVKKYSRYLKLRSCCVFGGVHINPQSAILAQGVEILVATPGRLLDHLGQNTLNLGQVRILVLDEADRMLDMGFLPDIYRIIQYLPIERQNLMFSATFSEPIAKLASGILRNPLLIEVARHNSVASSVLQMLYLTTENGKLQSLRDTLATCSQALVFTNTRGNAEQLVRSLQNSGFSVSAIHGDKSQTERLLALNDFKSGKVRFLIATDVAARGLDIEEMPCVINYDLPYAAEDYIHRIGRTGRAGMSGRAISLMTENDEKYLLAIEQLIKHKIDRSVAPRGDLPIVPSIRAESLKELRGIDLATVTASSNAVGIQDSFFDDASIPSSPSSNSPVRLNPRLPSLLYASKRHGKHNVSASLTPSSYSAQNKPSSPYLSRTRSRLLSSTGKTQVPALLSKIGENSVSRDGQETFQVSTK